VLEIGSTPTISLEDTDGTTVDLEKYRGKDNVFIYFMRALSCAQCNAAVQNMAKNSADFDAANVTVLIAVPEDPSDAAAWKAKKNIPFPVVVGKSGTAHAEAGLLRKVFGAIQQSGGILLDSQGVVRYTHVSTNPGASYSPREVADQIAALQPVG
jgi:peroxiredoxin